MMPPLVQNLHEWMAQTVVVAAAGAVLPALFRVRHPKMQLIWCHLVLAVCFVLPWLQPWRAGQVPVLLAWLPLVVAAGVVGRGLLLAAALWQARRHRIAATPLYPIPESVRAASAVTHADALFCISEHARSPVMLGWLTPVVLLPGSFLQLEEEGQCGIACHELLHARRGDWLFCLIEEAVGVLMWFNPAAWLLLAQARLAREQIVDEEAVRLTASREPYIEALLAIAKGGSMPDLAPSPLFLKRRELTHRMHSLLKDATVSRPRLLVSYCSITAMLIFAGWFAANAFPFSVPAQAAAVVPAPAPPTPQPIAVPEPKKASPVITAFQAAQPQPRPAAVLATRLTEAPVPYDVYEPVRTPLRDADYPRVARNLIATARRNALAHNPSMPPFQFESNFTASGSAALTGAGQVTETWWNGQAWRWTAKLGGYNEVRIPGRLTNPAALPMRAQMMRNAIFWAVFGSGYSPEHVRTAAVQIDGRAATCVLISGKWSPETGRIWEEEEYCVDEAAGVLLVHSIAPGTYTYYGYHSNIDFHGRKLPDRITTYVNGAMVLDGSVTYTDPGPMDESQVRPTPEMVATDPDAVLAGSNTFRMDVANPGGGAVIKPVLVHASVTGAGQVEDAEICASSDAALAQPALDLVKKTQFPNTNRMRQMYVYVRYIPAAQ